MKAPAKHPREAERLRILESLALVYSPAEERFDRITRLARRMFNVDCALISLVSEDRQWFKANSGLDSTETAREISFCGHAILEEDTFVVRDAREHPDFADNPLVTGPPHIRFYAGHPLRVAGQPIGTLCIMDDEPRELTEQEIDSLQTLCAMAEVECGIAQLSEGQKAVLSEHGQGDRELLIDPATRCWNARALATLLPREIALSNRSKESCSYLHAELSPDPETIDGLSEGEPEVVLNQVAKRMKRALRPYDLVARIGPVRFAIFAPSCSAEVSELLADRVRSRVADAPFEMGETSCSIDVTFGIASALPNEDLTPDRLEKVANLALEDAIESARPHMRLMI